MLIFYLFIFLGGVIRYTEEALEKALVWDVCLLHSNERPYIDFFKYCDGSGVIHKTTSPEYHGHIGKHFKNKLKLEPIVNFRAIPGKVLFYPPDFVATLNNDGRYLLNICHAIQSGYANFPVSLTRKLIGKVHSARYLFSDFHLILKFESLKLVSNWLALNLGSCIIFFLGG